MAIEGPGHDPDVDEEFARIVAGWDDVATTSGSAALSPIVRIPAAPGDGSRPDVDRPGDETADAMTESEPDSSDPQDDDQPGPPTDPFASPTGHDDRGQADAAPDEAARPAESPLPAEAGLPNEAVGTGARADDGAAGVEGSDPEGVAWRGYLPDEPDEHFEPPEPQLPPAHDATYWLAVLGLVAGPLLVLYAVVLSGDPDPGWLIVGGLLLTMGGFGLLIMRGSGERDPDDDGSRV